MSRKPRKYAQGTKTNIETTQIAIRRLLEQFGAVDGFVTGEQAGIAVLSFHMQSRRLTFRFAIPRVRPGEERKNAAAVNETKRLWRAVLLCIKAKLESVRSGIETFEDAFLAQTVLPTGETVGEWASKAVPQALEGRPLPPLLGGSRRDE